MTSVLRGKDHIFSGWWSKIEVTQVLGIYIYITTGILQLSPTLAVSHHVLGKPRKFEPKPRELARKPGAGETKHPKAIPLRPSEDTN